MPKSRVARWRIASLWSILGVRLHASGSPSDFARSGSLRSSNSDVGGPVTAASMSQVKAPCVPPPADLTFPIMLTPDGARSILLRLLRDRAQNDSPHSPGLRLGSGAGCSDASPFRFVRVTKRKNKGTKKVARKVAATMPPMTPVPTEWRLAEPAPVLIASGTRQE